jgi:hypothetical protein
MQDARNLHWISLRMGAIDRRKIILRRSILDAYLRTAFFTRAPTSACHPERLHARELLFSLRHEKADSSPDKAGFGMTIFKMAIRSTSIGLYLEPFMLCNTRPY